MLGFEVQVERDWTSDGVKVWFYHRYEGKLLVAQTRENNTYENIELEQGERWPEPTFTLPSDLFAKLVAAGSDFFPPSAATERHLEDAIKVRDRALDILLSPRISLPSLSQEK